MRVLFIFSEYSLHNNIIEDFKAARPQDDLFIIKVPLVLKGRSRTETVQKILPQASLNFLIAKLIEFIALGIITFIPKILPFGPTFRRLSKIAKRVEAPYLRTDNIMSESTVTKIREWKPDVVFTLFHQIVKEPLISLPRYGVINIHPGILPDFRGIQPYFWSLANGAPESGVTLHYIENDEIDQGSIIATSRHKLWRGMSVQLNYYITCRLAAMLLPDIAESIEMEQISAVPQQVGGNYFKWPDQNGLLRLKERGSAVISIRQLTSILIGKFENEDKEAQIKSDKPHR